MKHFLAEPSFQPQLLGFNGVSFSSLIRSTDWERFFLSNTGIVICFPSCVTVAAHISIYSVFNFNHFKNSLISLLFLPGAIG